VKPDNFMLDHQVINLDFAGILKGNRFRNCEAIEREERFAGDAYFHDYWDSSLHSSRSDPNQGVQLSS
jgi:hypothetical protein